MGVTSGTIPPGVDSQKYEMDVAHFVGFGEPIEDRLALAETCVHERDLIRRKRTAPARRLPRFSVRPGPRRPAPASPANTPTRVIYCCVPKNARRS